MEHSSSEYLLKDHSAAHTQDTCRDKGRGKESARVSAVCPAQNQSAMLENEIQTFSQALFQPSSCEIGF